MSQRSEAPIVILHGANGSGAEMRPLADALRPYGEVHAPDQPGHGGRPLPGQLAIEAAARDLVHWLDDAGIERAHVVGYSMGGYVALYLARHHAPRVQGACALATKYVFDAPTVRHWTYLADPERLARPGNPRAAQMLAAHGPGWKEVTRANALLFESLGAQPALRDDDLAAIGRPVMLVSSNRDQLVPWAETLAMGRLIPGARLAMFYGLAHPLFRVPVWPVGRAIGEWMRAAGSA